jgi:hypothetical protein
MVAPSRRGSQPFDQVGDENQARNDPATIAIVNMAVLLSSSTRARIARARKLLQGGIGRPRSLLDLWSLPSNATSPPTDARRKRHDGVVQQCPTGVEALPLDGCRRDQSTGQQPCGREDGNPVCARHGGTLPSNYVVNANPRREVENCRCIYTYSPKKGAAVADRSRSSQFPGSAAATVANRSDRSRSERPSPSLSVTWACAFSQ